MSEVKNLTQNANEVFSQSDSTGRELKVRKPSALKRFRFVGMLGKAADSDRYMSMVGPLLYLYGIDEDTDIQLNTAREMEALIQRLGDEGYDTLVELINKHFAEDEQNDVEAEKAKIKE